MSTNRLANTIVFYGLSDRGRQRENNEDHFIVADLTRQIIGVQDNRVTADLIHHPIGARGTLLIVADGLGGHEGGEIASQLAVDVAVEALLAKDIQDLPLAEQLMHAVDAAHMAICQRHAGSGHPRRMASTFTAIHIGPERMTIVQVGDSRAYRFSQGQLTQLTEDQTVVHMMQKKGLLSAEEAAQHPHKNVILQALGQEKTIFPELQTLPIHDGDCLLLCSDGLSSYVPHEAIEAILASEGDEHLRCHRLVEAANGLGGADNVTVILARLILAPVEHDGANGPTSLQTGPAVPGASGTSKKSIWATEIHLPWFSKSSKAEAGESATKSPQSMWTRDLKLPWSHKDASAPEDEEPADKEPRTSIWKREIKWPWGGKAAHPEASPADEGSREPLAPVENTEQSAPPPERHDNLFSRIRPKERKSADSLTWEPHILKALEESLARYIGPVAKIVVGRAAGQTHDLDELCQLLAAKLTTEEDKQHFLRAVIPLSRHGS